MMYRKTTFAFVCLLAMTGVYLFMFREIEFDNPEIGLLVHRYRWGKAAEIEVDVDRDGLVDGRYLVDGFSTHDRVFEGWEASLCDGNFDVHMLLGDQSILVYLEYDADKDGVFELTYRGERARDFLVELQRPARCRASQKTTGDGLPR